MFSRYAVVVRTYVRSGGGFYYAESPVRPLKRDGTVPISIPPPSPPALLLHSQDEIELYPFPPPSPARCISISPKTNGAGNRMGNQRFVSESSREMQREEQAVSFRGEWRCGYGVSAAGNVSVSFFFFPLLVYPISYPQRHNCLDQLL